MTLAYRCFKYCFLLPFCLFLSTLLAHPSLAQDTSRLSSLLSGSVPSPSRTAQQSPSEAAARKDQTKAAAPERLQQVREDRSEFETYISSNGAPSLAIDIRQFGYELFKKPPTTFAPVEQVPVGPDYVVGPGDTIKIDVWGKVEGSWSLVVDNDGNLIMPRIGVIGVTGLTYQELKETLQKEFSKYYTGFEMNVSMGSLRTIRVYVVGNAQRPGAYTISSLSTIINGLFEGGGPSKAGSMRNIQLKRKGKTVTTFDLYDFLLQGDKSNDLRLMPEDVLFIPPVGPLVGIAGNVKTPAIYELKGETRLLDLVRMAGGITGNAYTGRVQMRRVENHHQLITFEGDLIDIEQNPEKNFLLQDGDLARIFSVADLAKTATITGAVVYPGEYGVSPGITTIKDLVTLAGGRLYYTSDQAEITRLTVTPEGPKTDIFMVDLAKAMENDAENNIFLQMNDYVFVRTVPEWGLYRTVSIAGEVKFPGAYTIKKGETLSSLISRAGGYTEKAYLRGAMFTREKVREQQQKQINEMAERLERELFGAATSQVSAASSPEEAKILQMEIEQKKSFIDQLKAARAKGRVAIKLLPLNEFQGSSYDLTMEDGDSLVVPADPKTVMVIGSVYNQSSYVLERGKTFDHYIGLSGGYTNNADDDNVYILQADGFASKADAGFLHRGNRVESGDTIVVPEKLERLPWMRNFKDLTQILYQIAVTAGVLIVVF